MPQYVNYENIKNWKKVCYINDELNPVTNYLRMITMSIGLHSITEDNYKDFYYRMKFQQTLSESREYYEKEFIITLDHVKEHIGLEVQQSRSWMTQETTRGYVFRMWKLYRERLENEQE